MGIFGWFKKKITNLVSGYFSNPDLERLDAVSINTLVKTTVCDDKQDIKPTQDEKLVQADSLVNFIITKNNHNYVIYNASHDESKVDDTASDNKDDFHGESHKPSQDDNSRVDDIVSENKNEFRPVEFCKPLTTLLQATKNKMDNSVTYIYPLCETNDRKHFVLLVQNGHRFDFIDSKPKSVLGIDLYNFSIIHDKIKKVFTEAIIHEHYTNNQGLLDTVECPHHMSQMINNICETGDVDEAIKKACDKEKMKENYIKIKPRPVGITSEEVDGFDLLIKDEAIPPAEEKIISPKVDKEAQESELNIIQRSAFVSPKPLQVSPKVKEEIAKPVDTGCSCWTAFKSLFWKQPKPALTDNQRQEQIKATQDRAVYLGLMNKQG